MKTASSAMEAITGKFVRGEALSGQDFRVLLGLASHPTLKVREAALSLLLNPPATDILFCYRGLLDFLITGLRNLQGLPLPLWELLWEFIAVRGQIPGEPAVALFFERMVRHLPPALVFRLRQQALPLRPFLAHLRLASAGLPTRSQTPACKRRWRLLRKRLLASAALPSWAQSTFADLGRLSGRKPATRRTGIPPGGWLGHGRPLVLSPATACSPPVNLALRHCIWGGIGVGTRRYVDRLLSAHVEELRQVRALAQAVSGTTRRVVLSWHNATLAASSGWAFEELRAQFPSRAVWEDFKQAVQRRLRGLPGTPPHDPGVIQALSEQWKRRLVVPKMYHAWWEARLGAVLDRTCEADGRKLLEEARNRLQLSDLGLPCASKGYGWLGPVSPHQCLARQDLLAWSARRESAWHNDLLRLAALLQEGQLLLESDLLPHLVLPWIDKFFISSRRENDWEYLTTLVGWLAGWGVPPLILFWEDTPHPREPSLKLVLERLHAQGQPFRGIGVFDGHGSSREDALSIICRGHRQTLLYALRPLHDAHHYHSFQQLLADCPYAFFAHYDSSWKDGLCFLYSGTQVFPLLSVPTDREDVPAWLGGEGLKHPFGCIWRRRLREAVLGRRPEDSDSLSVLYAMGANLC